jgi:diguanylate cyclase (GGDEF)-like protein
MSSPKAAHPHDDSMWEESPLPSHLTQDSTFKEMGNKHAHKEFLKTPTKGVHLRIDINHLGDINSTHGHETGDKALKAIGTNLLSAASEAAGKDAKVFKLGGDKFSVHVPTHEVAAQLARNLRAKLEVIPSVNGTHNLSVCLGIGQSNEHAHNALIDAKIEKTKGNHKPGTAPMYVVSAIPGSEGVIPQSLDLPGIQKVQP